MLISFACAVLCCVVVVSGCVFVVLCCVVVMPDRVFIVLRRVILHSNQTGSGAYTTWLMAPTYFPRGGNVYSGAVRDASSGGYWWSSTVDSATGARRLSLGPSVIYLAGSNGRFNGFSLRCLQQQPNR